MSVGGCDCVDGCRGCNVCVWIGVYGDVCGWMQGDVL